MRYIGGKTKILPFLTQVVSETVQNADTFCDLFSGTGCVGRFFKRKYRVFSNDMMYFSFLINFASVELNFEPEFKNLGFEPVSYLNNMFEKIPVEFLEGFFEREYSEKAGRLYFTQNNALRIDYARSKIEEWRRENRINESEYFYLLACLVSSVPFVSNISGTFGAYNKFWDKRAKKDFVIRKTEVFDNKKENKCFNKDANELIKELEGDILYLDPPYNTRQYISNYHILETLARWDEPELIGITGLRANQNEQKSKYCRKQSASEVLEDLIEKARFRHIFLSYNTEGIIPEEKIEEIFSKYKNFRRTEIPYKTFKSNSRTKDRTLKELIFYAEK